MLVLLPPSEGKAPGGRGASLDLDALSFPALTPVRQLLVDHLQSLARTDPAALAKALGLSAGQTPAVEADACLTSSPTLPALERYTGIVYDNLSASTLTGAARRRARESLVVCSALFGLLRPGDRVPLYRLSGSTSLPRVPALAAMWRPVLERELDVRGLVVDLRSGPYAALARVPRAVQVRVLRDEGGRRTVVSHDNKWTKGQLARALCVEGARTLAHVAEVGRTVCDDVEVDGLRVDLLQHGLASARGA